jgi:putative phosphoesterase
MGGRVSAARVPAIFVSGWILFVGCVAGMRLGIVSNSIGNPQALARAVELLEACGVEVILHCGDVGGRSELEALAKVAETAEAVFIWGDRDRDRMESLRHAQRLKLTCYGVLGSFELEGKQIGMCHGDEPGLVRRLVDEQQHDYLMTGHAVQREEQRVGKTRVISPGTLGAQGPRTVAVLDLESDELQFLSVDEGPTPAAEGEAQPMENLGGP